MVFCGLSYLIFLELFFVKKKKEILDRFMVFIFKKLDECFENFVLIVLRCCVVKWVRDDQDIVVVDDCVVVGVIIIIIIDDVIDM